MKRTLKENRTNILIGMMIFLLILLLVSDWTDFLGNLRNISLTREINNWLKVISYFPIIWIIQIFLLKIEKLYGVGLFFYAFFFFLNAFVLFNRISKYYEMPDYDQIILIHLSIKTFEQILLGFILYLIIKITSEQKSNNLLNNKLKGIS